MATTAVNFVLQDEQAGLGGGSKVLADPFVEIFERQSALQQTSRHPGGGSYRQPPWTVTNSVIALDDVVTEFSADGLAKHGAIHFTTTGTTAVTVDLLDLTANTPTSYVGDTTFATWNKIIAFNCSGLDGVAAADMTLAAGASNPARLPLGGTSPTLTIPASSPVVLFDKAGQAVDSTHNAITITPTAGGNVVLLVAGS